MASNWPQIYALFMMVIVPSVTYAVVPVSSLRIVYYCVVSAFGFVAAWVLLESFISVVSTVVLLARAKFHLGFDPGRKWPEVTYIIPAYLNNEAPILDETLESYQQLRYPGRLHVMIVYNANGNLAQEEATLRRRWHGFSSGRFDVTVIANSSSRSKAENVNAGLKELTDKTEYVFVMDADHHPVPIHTMLAILTMEQNGYDVVQGACSIRRDGVLSWIVAAEFEDMYNVGHRGRTSLFGIGVFGGSNGCWKRGLLADIKMDPSMLTEDIDSSLRATLQGAKIGYCSQLISSEEAPVTEKTLRKQRLRWAQGWFEVSIKHLFSLMTSRHTSLRQKFGFFTLLCFRELFVYITFHPIILVVIYVIRYPGSLAVQLLFLIAGASIFSVGPLRVLAAYMLSQGEVAGSGSMFLLYGFAQVFWCAYLNILQVMAHAQHFLGYNAWVPTVRESVNKTNAQPATGLPRIATTMGLDDHMSSVTSAILLSPSAAASAVVALHESKGGKAGSSSNSSSEPLPDSAIYRDKQKPRAGSDLQRLYPSSVFVHSLAPATGEAVPLMKNSRAEIEPTDSISFDRSAYKMAIHHDGNVFHLVPVEGGQGVPRNGAAQPGVLKGTPPKTFSISTAGASSMSQQALPLSPVAHRPASPPWFDPARAARAGFKGRVTFDIGSPRSDVHESPSGAASDAKSFDTASFFNEQPRDTSSFLAAKLHDGCSPSEGTGGTSSCTAPSGKVKDELPLPPTSCVHVRVRT